MESLLRDKVEKRDRNVVSRSRAPHRRSRPVSRAPPRTSIRRKTRKARRMESRRSTHVTIITDPQSQPMSTSKPMTRMARFPDTNEATKKAKSITKKTRSISTAAPKAMARSSSTPSRVSARVLLRTLSSKPAKMECPTSARRSRIANQ